MTQAEIAEVFSSWPARYSSVLLAAGSGGYGGEDPIRRRVQPGDWSAVEHLAHVSEALSASAGRISRVAHRTDAVLSEVVVEAPHATDNDTPLETLLEKLSDVAGRLARLVEEISGAELTRTGMWNDERVTVAQLLARALHEGDHHLWAVGQAMAADDTAWAAPAPPPQAERRRPGRFQASLNTAEVVGP